MLRLNEAARAFLNEKRFAVLATINPNGTPQQTVMWYRFEGDHILMNTARGRKKDRNLLRDPRASICIEDGQRYVTISGEVTLIEDQDRAQADIRALAIRYDGQEQGEAQSRDYFSKQERITILMSIEDVDVRGFA